MVEFWFSPKGRAARADYWYWLMIPAAAGAVALGLIGPLIFGPDIGSILLLAGFAVFFISHMALSIKRLHDQSLSGWYSIALILPLALGGAWITYPDAIDFAAIDGAEDRVKLALLGMFAIVFAPFAYVLGLIWFVIGKDGVNRYGRDPLYR